MPDPKQIDHFEILGVLGRGGIGKVYLARDMWPDRQVAIKVVTIEAQTEDERNARDEFMRRLVQEAGSLPRSTIPAS